MEGKRDMSIQALREQRAAKAKELHTLVNETTKDKAWTPENQAAYDSAMAEIDDLDARITRITDLNTRVAEDALTAGVIDAADRLGHDKKSESSRLFAKWLRVGDDGLSAEDRAAIQNTMSTTTGSEGGYTVPTEVANQVLDALKAYGGMRAVATVIRTATGVDMNFPTSDGTSETGELLAQNASAAAADITFGVKTLSVYKYSSKIVAVPIELLQDSNADIETFIRNRLVTRLGRITNTHFTTGTGSGQPQGIVGVAGSGKVGTTGQTATVIYNDLVDVQHSIDPAYRAPGNCRWMMNDASVKIIRKIVDGNSRPIFVPGYEFALPTDGKAGGIPDSLLGDPVQVNQDVATMAANAKSILYGDFSYYTIRDALDVQMFRFTDSVYASKGQVGFLAFLRAGGQFVDVGGSVKYYQNSAT
jgi:HK97 family phage major capsid protein